MCPYTIFDTLGPSKFGPQWNTHPPTLLEFWYYLNFGGYIFLDRNKNPQNNFFKNFLAQKISFYIILCPILNFGVSEFVRTGFISMVNLKVTFK